MAISMKATNGKATPPAPTPPAPAPTGNGAVVSLADMQAQMARMQEQFAETERKLAQIASDAVKARKAAEAERDAAIARADAKHAPSSAPVCRVIPAGEHSFRGGENNTSPLVSLTADGKTVMLSPAKILPLFEHCNLVLDTMAAAPNALDAETRRRVAALRA